MTRAAAPAASAAKPAEGTPVSERLLLAAVGLGGLLAPLNSTMIAVALPDIRDDFALSHGAIGWLVSSYLITMAVAQPVAGSLADQLGRARVFRGALVGFLVFSLAATFAPTFEVLVALRVGQAAAGAALIPTALAMIRSVIPVERLGRTNGVFNAVLGVTAASGPLFGALLLELASWRLLFIFNVPFVALALLLQTRLRYRDAPTGGRAALDWTGAALLTVLLVAATWLFGAIGGDRGSTAIILGSGAVLVLTIAFVASQLRGAATVAPWGLFRIPSFAGATVYIMVSNLVMYTSLLTIPFFVREVQDGAAATIGLLLGAMSFLMAASAPLSGRLSDAIGRRKPALWGGAISFVAALALAIGIDADASFTYLAASLALLGFGIGLGTGAATTAAIESVPRAIAGSASGTNSMMRYAGSIAGAAVLSALLESGGTVPGVGAFRTIFIVVSAMALVTVVAATAIHTRVDEEGLS